MTDLEMTRLCAIAMKLATVAPPKGYEDLIIIAGLSMPYVPLHDDAQAMALDDVILREFFFEQCADIVHVWKETNSGFFYCKTGTMDAANRRRWRVECVAKMQTSKERESHEQA